jgi:hypothetical protein
MVDVTEFIKENVNEKKSIILILSIVVLITLVAVLFVTNITYNKHYDYNTDEKSINDLKIGARLLGQYKYENRTILYTKPYELFVWIRIEQGTFSPKLSRISLTNKENDSIILLSPQNAIVERENGVTYFAFKAVELEYYDYDLLLEYKLEGDKKPSTITLSLKKNYKEFISFRFWDRLMSV